MDNSESPGVSSMTKPINILFLGAGRRVSLFQEFRNAAFELGIDIKLYTYELTEYVHVAHIAEVLIGVKFGDWAFYNDLSDIIKMYEIDIVIPMMDSATVALSHFKENLKYKTDAWLVTGGHNTNKLFYNKQSIYRTNIETAVLHKPPSVFLIPLTINPDERMLPIILKPILGYGSKDQTIITQEPIPRIDYRKYIAQKYFYDCKEYTVDCYVDRGGVIKGISPRQRLLVARGEVENSVTVVHDIIRVKSEQLLRHYHFQGPVTIQFLHDNVSGGVYFLEINPRFGGGVLLTIQAGLNYPKYIIQDYLGHHISDLQPEPDVLMIRSNRETYFHGWKDESN